MALIGYARVSTTDQDSTMQRDALARAGCDPIFTDQASGATADRPGLAEALAYVRRGDVLVFHIFGALAQFERDLIRERTHAGLKAAEARGRRGGRKPAITPDKLARARAHIAAGLTVREAAARLKVGKTALYKALASSTTTPVA